MSYNILAYNQSLSLLTDFYQITMAYGYWKAKVNSKEAVFHMFFRNNPLREVLPLPAAWSMLLIIWKTSALIKQILITSRHCRVMTGNRYLRKDSWIIWGI